jgi:predicted nucleotidyltransferase
MKAEILKSVQSLCREYRIESLYVFGSRAKEVFQYVHGTGRMDDRYGSDVDMGVLTATGDRLSERGRVRLTIDLENLFGVRRVDLVILPEVSPFLALEVIQGELLFTAAPDETAEYELYVLRRAGDLAYFERQRRHQILTGRFHDTFNASRKDHR